jgi:diguanylate cyclase (GGDEF)-like protein/PAS domain S-box-containing protein
MAIESANSTKVKPNYNDSLRQATLQASHCLTTGSVDQAIPAILATIGESLEVERVLVFEDQPQNEGSALSVCYSWQQPHVPRVTPELFAEYPLTSPEIPTWLRPVRDGHPVITHRRNTAGAVADLFQKMQIQSLLMVPIAVDHAFWGCVGVDACKREREWLPVEIDLLKILANLIGTTILRDRSIIQLRNSEERFHAVAETAQDAIIMIDATGLIEYWNPAATRILGYTAVEAMGRNVHDLLTSEQTRELADERLHAVAVAGNACAVGKIRELEGKRKDGSRIPVELALAKMTIGGQWRAVGILRDVTVRRRTEQRVSWLARHDVLTGLPNRTVFLDEIRQSIDRSRRSNKQFAVYYLDLDHFKDVNDTLGHPAGDLLLQAVAERLKKSIRNTDRIARFGGDEFAILANELTEPTDAGIVAGKILDAMSAPFFINNDEVHTGTSIGIAAASDRNEAAEALLAHADVALYHAKQEGRGIFRFFTDAMDREVRHRYTLLSELREAIDRHQLFLVYQPQVDMETRDILGLEALVRWRHPCRGIVSPGQFIPAAENSGLIISLGQWVLLELCRQARRWLDAGIDLPVIAVNVSPTQFKSPSDLASEIGAMLHASGLAPSMLEIELTETALMQASRHNAAVLQNLRNQGIRVAIDDFGTGYSCLDYLRRFPASRIKIAQTFVADIAHDAGSAAITRAAIGLGRELGLGVIAEGVETAEQVALLRSWGCKEAQGYHFVAPIASEQVATLLRQRKLPHRN